MGAGAVSRHKKTQEGISAQESTSHSGRKFPSATSGDSFCQRQDCLNSEGNNNCCEHSTQKLSEAGHASEIVPEAGSKPKASLNMSCELCSVNFTFFKRKKYCVECQRYFCSTCLPKPPSSAPPGRQCSKCRLLLSGRFTRNDLEDYKVKDIRSFLKVKNISMAGCKEKHDLVELVLSNFCHHPRNRGLMADDSEHDLHVRQMTAHVRDVSFVRENGASSPSSAGSSTSCPQQQERAQTSPQPTSAVPVSSSSSSSATTTTPFVPQVSGVVFTSSSSSSPLTTAADSAHPPPPPPSSTVAPGAAASTTQTAAEEVSNRQGTAGEEEENGGERMFSFDQERWRDFLDIMNQLEETLGSTQEEDEETPAAPPVRRTQLNDVKALEDVEKLTIRQLKELLVNNFVDYRGCCERRDLVEKVKNLWKDHLENVAIAQEIQNEDEAEAARIKQETAAKVMKGNAPEHAHVTQKENCSAASLKEPGLTKDTNISNNQDSSAADISCSKLDGKSEDAAFSATTTSAQTETTTTAAAAATGGADSSSPSRRARNQHDSLCHICMDSLADCILLECGHMVTCTQCGKRLANCPICRQFIVRVVRVFRS
ncbi:E3 ubiquitin-protein ligase rnf34 [Plakobranchus ocellatus]|uniref:E3 ubiquitin-protein ligase rnf34 n=1 Tax=Plakobranchus ocellatus TaxID=259542 RepID=A0AAV3ZY52_9GAST|nr:E3 ubiquitin-protein ligase rnf34 [Plakobranchus ocellatus]